MAISAQKKTARGRKNGRKNQLLNRERLEELLVQTGMITGDKLQAVLRTAEADNQTVEQVLLEEGILSSRDLVTALSIQLKVPLIDLKRHSISPVVLQLIPEDVARKYNIIPLDVIAGFMSVVMENPMDVPVVDDLSAVAKMPIVPMMGFPDDIREAIDRKYAAGYGTGEEIVLTTSLLEEEEEELEEFLSEESQVPVIQFLNRLLPQAVRRRASDIHIEPEKDRVQIRFRIDGVLQTVRSLDLNMHHALITRLKIMGGMNIAERRRPQDGQCSMKIDGWLKKAILILV